MGQDDEWIANLLAGARQQSKNWRKGQQLKKICQWVEHTTPVRTCPGIVLKEGTFYCPYHDQIWEVVKNEDV